MEWPRKHYLSDKVDERQLEFARIFEETTKLGQELDGSEFQLSQPRIVGRQSHRSNVAVTSAEDYYHISIYNEFLSHVTAELKERFNHDLAHSVRLLHLLPTRVPHVQDADIPPELSKAVDFYKNDLPHPIMFPTEFRMWAEDGISEPWFGSSLKVGRRSTGMWCHKLSQHKDPPPACLNSPCNLLWMWAKFYSTETCQNNTPLHNDWWPP